MKDIPTNSHFHFDFIFSMDNVQYEFGNYLSHNFHTYLLLKPGTNHKQFEKNFVSISINTSCRRRNISCNIKSMDDFEKSGNRLTYTLMPLTKIHLHADPSRSWARMATSNTSTFFPLWLFLFSLSPALTL